jgi:hypothetical protein
MKFWKPAALTLALAAAYPGAALAQTNADLLKELKALRDRVGELEKKLADKPAPAPVPVAAEKQWGMTPEQVQDFNRIAVKTEATEDNLATQGLKGLTISGFIEPAYIYNRRQHRAGFQFLNDQSLFAYDTSYIGSASIDFTKETDSGTKWKLTLTPNRGVGAVIGAGIVQEASVSVPLTDPATRLIAGQIPDWSGYEYQQPTLNPFTTHNLLYDFTLPAGYTGAGTEIKRGKWVVKAMLANVNSTIRNADESSPAIVYRGDYSVSEYMGFGFAGLHGKAPNFGVLNADETQASTVAHLLEVDGYYTRADWTFQGQVGIGRQKLAAIATDLNGGRQDAQWLGLSGLAGYMITPRLQGLVRADYIHNTKNGGGLFTYNSQDDRNGLGVDQTADCATDPTQAVCNRGANRYAITTGVKFAFNPNTTFKTELRLDGASRPVFIDVKSGKYRKTNQLLGASVVVFF